MEKKTDNFISLPQAAAILKVHRLTLWNWIKNDIKIKKEGKNYPKCFKCPRYHIIGHRYKFFMKDLENFVTKAEEN